jgi:hypothetical protein
MKKAIMCFVGKSKRSNEKMHFTPSNLLVVPSAVLALNADGAADITHGIFFVRIVPAQPKPQGAQSRRCREQCCFMQKNGQEQLMRWRTLYASVTIRTTGATLFILFTARPYRLHSRGRNLSPQRQPVFSCHMYRSYASVMLPSCNRTYVCHELIVAGAESSSFSQ